MRKLLAMSVTAVLVGCGVFSASDDDEKPNEELPPPATPQDNALPPPPVGSDAPEGIFVMSKGDDNGSGTATNPLKTLAKAFAVAKDRGLRVIACAEKFDESLTLVDGVSAAGYYDCASTPWKRVAARAVVQSKTSPAAVARNITLPTRLEGFEIVAPDLDGAPATDEAGSSIALYVVDSKGLVVSESLLHGGKGAPGTDGEDGPGNTHPTSNKGANGVERATSDTLCNPSLSNCDTRKVIGPAAATSACTVGASGAGGAGGDGTWYNQLTPILVQPATWNGKPVTATVDTAAGGGPGMAGTTGAVGADGQDGATGAWSFADKGFVRGNGKAGTDGAPGKGGGGGGGSMYYLATQALPPTIEDYARSSTGGSGGGGGCGGLISKPGFGGGASVGALVFASEVRFEKTRIETSAGGRAGRGFFGGFGTTGASGGLAATLSGKGGDGGQGGSAGFSGHGAPGPSIALAFSGAKPTVDQVDLAPGPAGIGWPQEQKPDGARVKVLPGVVGESKAEHAIVR